MKQSIPQQIAKLLTRIFTEMILHRDKLKVEAVEMRRSFTIYTEANYTDSKRIVGSQGSHFNAVRTFVKAAARKHGLNAELDKIQTVGRITQDQYPPFVARDDWPKQKISELINDMAKAVFAHESEIEINIVDAPAGSANIDVIVSAGEDSQLVAEMLAVFKVLIRPVGKSNHRNLIINVIADKPCEQQPASADGRHMKQITR